MIYFRYVDDTEMILKALDHGPWLKAGTIVVQHSGRKVDFMMDDLKLFQISPFKTKSRRSLG